MAARRACCGALSVEKGRQRVRDDSDEATFGKVMRWMTENLEISSRVYRTRHNTLSVDPGLIVLLDGQVVRDKDSRPEDLRAWLLNSATVLIACCYIDALGKILTRGKKAGKNPNLRRFRAFVVKHMRGFVAECR